MSNISATKVFIAAAIVVTIMMAVTALYLKEQRTKLAIEKTAVEQTIAAARQQQTSLGTVNSSAELSVAEAQRITQSRNNAVDASKQYQQQLSERSKRGKALSEALIAAQEVKTASAEYFQSEGRWPANHAAVGMPPPESDKNETLRSVSIEPFGQSIRIRIKFIGQAPAPGLEQQLHFIASASGGAGRISWSCVSPDIKDIADLLPNCKYQPS